MRKNSSLFPFLFALSLATAPSTAAKSAKERYNPPASKAELSAIEARGLKLYLYETALSASMEALKASEIKSGSVKESDGENFSSLVELNQNGFRTAFGRLGGEKQCYFIDFLVEGEWQDKAANSPRVGQAVFLSPPREDQGSFLAMARALSLVKEEKAKLLPYRNHHYAVLPDRQPDTYFVYFYPGPKVQDTYLLGGDLRVRVEGNQVKEWRLMHRSILSYPNTAGGKKQMKPLIGVHSAVMDERPEDSDVMHVLLRKPSTAEMVLTKTYLYEIEKSGKIKYRGTIKSYLKGGRGKSP